MTLKTYLRVAVVNLIYRKTCLITGIRLTEIYNDSIRKSAPS
jgi:hypothetical protein